MEATPNTDWWTPEQTAAMARLAVRFGVPLHRLYGRTSCAFGDVLMLTWDGMTYGIEKDGYIHT